VILYEDENGQTVFEYDWTMSCDPPFLETRQRQSVGTRVPSCRSPEFYTGDSDDR